MDVNVSLNNLPSTSELAPSSRAVQHERNQVADRERLPVEQREGRTANELQEVVDSISEFIQSVQRNLEFSVDEESGRVVVKVLARDSGELIRQIPSEEVLKLAQNLDDARSLLFSAKA